MATILIVEDNPNNMKLAQLLLETSGHDVLQAINAQDGINLRKVPQKIYRLSLVTGKGEKVR